MKSALLVIDYQNAIFTEPPAYQADIVLERIRQLIEKARQSGAPVIYVQHEEAGTTWEAGSKTWEFPNAIAPQAEDYVSPKNSCDAFRNSSLDRHLFDQGIQRIFICGYATEFCIDTNVRRAAILELETVVVADAHTTRNRPHLDAQKIIEHHNWIWKEFGNPGNQLRLCSTRSVRFAES